MNRKSMRVLAATAAGTALIFGLSACGAGNESGSSDDEAGLKGTLNGAGASSQEAAVAAWKAGFQTKNPDVTVNYDPAGSGAGREQFIAGGVQFAGSDAYLDDEELKAAETKCGSPVVSVPTYVSPIALAYNLEGVDNLQLSPATAAGIFSGKITSWDDAAIKADNPDATLPSQKITPVHRSDDSGTTENFTDWLHATAPDAWTAEAAQTWPVKGGEAAKGTSGVVEAVKAGAGAIGYADSSQVGDGLGKAAVKVGEAFVAPSEDAAAKMLDEATLVDGREATDLALTLNRTTTAADTYPIVLVSYQMTCQKQPDADTAALVKGWFEYVTSEDGQAEAEKNAGSAPLTEDFSSKVADAVGTITK